VICSSAPPSSVSHEHRNCAGNSVVSSILESSIHMVGVDSALEVIRLICQNFIDLFCSIVRIKLTHLDYDKMYILLREKRNLILQIGSMQ
jgi:hypothetical protein